MPKSEEAKASAVDAFGDIERQLASIKAAPTAVPLPPTAFLPVVLPSTASACVGACPA